MLCIPRDNAACVLHVHSNGVAVARKERRIAYFATIYFVLASLHTTTTKAWRCSVTRNLASLLTSATRTFDVAQSRSVNSRADHADAFQLMYVFEAACSSSARKRRFSSHSSASSTGQRPVRQVTRGQGGMLMWPALPGADRRCMINNHD